MDTGKLFKNLDICEEALAFTEKLLKECRDDETDSLLKDVQLLVKCLENMLQEESDVNPLVRSAVLSCKNMEHSINKFLSSHEHRNRIFQCEVFESFLRLRFLVSWQYKILLNSETSRQYQKKMEETSREIYRNRDVKSNFKYKVSIVVLAYNKLEYTKMAIESIMKFTDFSKCNAELITINNGSSDGTEEYFEGLPHEKKLNFKHNIFGIPIRNPSIVEGEYILEFSNDALATERWLEQLLFCIESDSRIAMVVPTCNEESITNLQGIPVSYANDKNERKKIFSFASRYNQSNSDLWEERSILMPFVHISRTDVWLMPIVSAEYIKIVFVDDDYSTILRRTGWRQVLAKDTFLHHFGSITLGDSKEVSNQNSLGEMRKVYFDKWGVDAWESRGILGIEHTFQWISPKKGSRILWIEPKFGADFLSMKNFYRKNGCDDVTVDAMVVDSRYLPDAKYYFDRCIPAENLLQAIAEAQDGYDIIGMSACLHEVVDGSAVALLEKLYEILNPGGQLLVPVKNWNSASCLKEIITSGGVHPWNCPANTFKGLSMWGLLGALAQHKYLKNYSRFVLTEPDKKLCKSMHSKLAKMFSDVYDSDTFETILQVNMMWLGFQKN